MWDVVPAKRAGPPARVRASSTRYGHAQLGRRQLVGPADDFGRRSEFQRRFVNEQGGGGRVSIAGAAACARGQGQHIGDVALAVVRGQRQGVSRSVLPRLWPRAGREVLEQAPIIVCHAIEDRRFGRGAHMRAHQSAMPGVGPTSRRAARPPFTPSPLWTHGGAVPAGHPPGFVSQKISGVAKRMLRSNRGRAA